MDETPATPASETPRPAWWAGPWPLAIFFFAWCFFIYTRNYQHPYYYEKDATTKVQQVMGGERNYFHPLLMLNTTELLLKVTGGVDSEQNTSDAGHLVMSFFGALAVAVFVLLAFRCGGWTAAFAVGVLLSLNDQLLARAHYFKEDPALVVGLSLSFLAMKLFHERPSLGRAAWLGAACAVAIAGKYVGVAALILAIPLVLYPPGGRWARLGVLLGATLVVVLAINWQWVVDFQALRKGFGTEMHDLTGREEMLKKIPHTQQVIDTYESGLPRWIAVGVFLQIAHLIWTTFFAARDFLSRSPNAMWVKSPVPGGNKRPVEWMLVLYPLIFSVILAWSPRLFERHFLPVFVCLWTSSGLGWVNAMRWIWQKFPKLPGSAAIASVIVIAICAGRLQRAYFHRHKEFASDYRAELAAFIRANVPADAVIAQDRRVFLLQPDEKTPRPEFGLTQKVISSGWLSDFGSLAELRKQGVTHLAMHKLDSGGFMKDGRFTKKITKENSSNRDRPARRAFYKDIENHARRLWEHEDGDDGAMNPGLLFYALEPEKK